MEATEGLVDKTPAGSCGQSYAAVYHRPPFPLSGRDSTPNHRAGSGQRVAALSTHSASAGNILHSNYGSDRRWPRSRASGYGGPGRPAIPALAELRVAKCAAEETRHA